MTLLAFHHQQKQTGAVCWFCSLCSAWTARAPCWPQADAFPCPVLKSSMPFTSVLPFPLVSPNPSSLGAVCVDQCCCPLPVSKAEPPHHCPSLGVLRRCPPESCLFAPRGNGLPPLLQPRCQWFRNGNCL